MREVGVQRSTIRRYQDALREFFRFSRSKGWRVPQSSSEFDDQLSDYINWLWAQRSSEGSAADVLSAAQRLLPRLRGKLAVSKFYFANWRRTLVRRRAWPFTALVTRGLAGIALHLQRPDLAAVLLLAFVALLRPREVLTLTYAGIRHYAQGRRGIVFLRASKTGQRHNVIEKVVVDDHLVLAAVRLAQRGRLASDPLYIKPQANFGRELRDLVRRAGMASSRVSGHSLRRGAQRGTS